MNVEKMAFRVTLIMIIENQGIDLILSPHLNDDMINAPFQL